MSRKRGWDIYASGQSFTRQYMGKFDRKADAVAFCKQYSQGGVVYAYEREERKEPAPQVCKAQGE